MLTNFYRAWEEQSVDRYVEGWRVSTEDKQLPPPNVCHSLHGFNITSTTQTKISPIHHYTAREETLKYKGDNFNTKEYDDIQMSRLKTKHKLIALCCCALLIAIISSVMVINAFLNWSTDNSSNITQETIFISPTLAAPNMDVSHRLPENGGIDIQIEINELTTYSDDSTDQKQRNWFHIEETGNVDIIDVGVIDIDSETDNEISGSGMNDNEDSRDYFLPVNGKLSKETAIQQEQTTTLLGMFTSSNILMSTSSISADKFRLSTQLSAPEERYEHTTPSSHTGFHGTVENFSYHIGNQVTQSTSTNTDKCEAWLNCEDPFLKDYLKKFSQLPTCPCAYPLGKGSQVYDPYHKKAFSWKESRYSQSYLYAYHKGAKRCIRSEVGPGTLAAQNCCYDGKGVLLTRGSGAGTPVIISPDVSSALHQLVDQVPWILCNGDWTRYNIARPPNNMQGCMENPPQIEYLYQVWLAKNH